MASSLYSGNGRSSGRAAAGRYRPMSEINVTPLVDVMLVLLVVFMVTAPLLTVGVPVELPQTQAPPINEPKEPLVITVNREGAVFVSATPQPIDTRVARRQPRRRALCARRQGDQLRAGARSDEPRDRCRLPQGVAGRRGAEGTPSGGASGGAPRRHGQTLAREPGG